MKSSNVISLGEALIDRLGPIGGDPYFDKPVTDCFGGAPANVACALSRLGVNVSFIGSVGNDAFGKNFKNLMIQRGINTIGLQEDKLRPTRIVLVRRDAYGERFFGGFEGDQGKGFADQAILREQIIKDWPLIVGQAKWLIIGTIPLAYTISSDAFLWCIENALKEGIRIAIDLNWRPTFWRNSVSKVLTPSLQEKEKINSILEHVSLIKLAKEEAQFFFKTCEPRKISLSLPQKPSVIVTNGSHPVDWLINNNLGKSKSISLSKIVDTTGAGDAFTAGLIYKILSYDIDQIDQDIAKNIIQFAISCGAHVCQGIGAIESQPYLEDVERILSQVEGGTS
tara:strand:- start:2296 stop:3312 length:1017 start_codon:yes stop_codon:yes gene_type:complete